MVRCISGVMSKLHAEPILIAGLEGLRSYGIVLLYSLGKIVYLSSILTYCNNTVAVLSAISRSRRFLRAKYLHIHVQTMTLFFFFFPSL